MKVAKMTNVHSTPLHLRALAPYVVATALACMWASSHAQTQPQAAPLNGNAERMNTAQSSGLMVMQSAPQQPVSLEEYLRLVVRNQPGLAADRLQLNLAKADSKTAAAFPNPSAHYVQKRGEKEWGIEQPLPIFGQRGMRMENARKGEVSAAENVNVAVASTLSDAAHAFNGLLVAQQRLAVWQGAQDELGKAGRIVKGQIEAGTRSRYDGARLNLQQAQMSMQVSKAQAELKDAASRVAATAALPQWSARAAGSLQADSSSMRPGYQTLWDQAQMRLPTLRAAQAELDQAQQKIKLEEREALPTPTIGVARIRDRYDGSYNQIGVNIEVPLFDRHQGAIERAKVEAEQAELRRDAALLAAQSELQRALEQLQIRRSAVIDYEKQGLAQIAPLHQMAQDAYKLGQGTILELIDALGSINEHRLEHLELVKEMLDAEWEVRLSSGNLPDTAP